MKLRHFKAVSLLCILVVSFCSGAFGANQKNAQVYLQNKNPSAGKTITEPTLQFLKQKKESDEVFRMTVIIQKSNLKAATDAIRMAISNDFIGRGETVPNGDFLNLIGNQKVDSDRFLLTAAVSAESILSLIRKKMFATADLSYSEKVTQNLIQPENSYLKFSVGLINFIEAIGYSLPKIKVTLLFKTTEDKENFKIQHTGDLEVLGATQKVLLIQADREAILAAAGNPTVVAIGNQ